MVKRRPRQVGFKDLLLGLFLFLLLWAAQQFLGIDLGGESRDGDVVLDPANVIEVLFTTPMFPDKASNHHGGPDEALTHAIDAASSSVDMAMYNLDLTRVADALIRADKRGVHVRLVTDNDYEDQLGPVRLRSAGIPVITDGPGPLMHNKFTVIDGYEVWTGSWNLTDSDTYRNNNNVVVIRSHAIAENYTTEFNEMFEDRSFGATSDATEPNPRVNLGPVLVETFFESEGDARSRIVELIDGAALSVRFLAFILTDDQIAHAIIERHRAGVEVAGVVEARNVGASGADYATLRNAGVDVIADGNPYIMHHKVIIIDDETVITGSYNFSVSAADQNDENVLILHSSEVAETYLEEFNRVRQQASDQSAEG